MNNRQIMKATTYKRINHKARVEAPSADPSRGHWRCMYICVYIYIYIYISYVYMCVCTCVYMYVCMIYIYIYAYMCIVCIHVYMSIYFSLYVYVYLSIYLSIYISIYISISLSICIYIYIYIYIYNVYRPRAPSEAARERTARSERDGTTTPSPPTNIVDFRGFDSSTILISRVEFPGP